MPFNPALGISDFRKLREEDAGYVDKTDFVSRVLSEPTEVTLVRPKQPGQPGVVLEFKVPRARRGETPEQALVAAAAQVRARRYAEELRAAGASPVHELVAVFDGKRAWVQTVDEALGGG